jgi:hypothetical protein
MVVSQALQVVPLPDAAGAIDMVPLLKLQVGRQPAITQMYCLVAH